MGKRHRNPSLVRQVQVTLEGMCRFGQSKHQAKAEAAATARAAGWTHNPAAVDGIYSHSTLHNYLAESVRFAMWVREESARPGNGPRVRTLEQARPWVARYLQDMVDRGSLSAWTIQKRTSALVKLFGDPEIRRQVTLPARTLADIRRSREETEAHRAWVKANPRVALSLAATGLRRSEANTLRAEQVRVEADGRVWLSRVRGKGGKVRDVPVLAGAGARALVEMAAASRERSDRVRRGRLFAQKLPKACQSHAVRRRYAQLLLARLLRTSRPYRSFGWHERRSERVTNALMQVSAALGHGRRSVVVSHYL